MDRMPPQSAMQECWTEADALRTAHARAATLRTAGARETRADGQRRRLILTRAVEAEVIPELLTRLIPQPAPAPVPAGPLVVSTTHVAELASLVLARNEPSAIAFIEALHSQGAAPESLYLDLLAPAARVLGKMWEDDSADFAEVALGLWRLQRAMNELAPAFVGHAPAAADAPRILLVPLPGETHTFGLSMVFDFFCRAGWNAWTGPIDSSADLQDMVRRQFISVLGFSLACDERLADVRTLITAVRRASKNPGIAIMVGGPGFTANPALASLVGADATATDGRQAVMQASALLNQAHRR